MEEAGMGWGEFNTLTIVVHRSELTVRHQQSEVADLRGRD